MIVDSEILVKETPILVKQVRELLAGKLAAVQGAVLLELVVAWVAANYYVIGDEVATNAIRCNVLLHMFDQEAVDAWLDVEVDPLL